MLRRVMHGAGLAGATLMTMFLLAACGEDAAGPGSSTAGTGNTTSSGGQTAAVAYAIKTDLCAETDFGPLKAVLPAVTKLKPDRLDRALGTLYACDGNAGKSEAYNDIGFITVVAYFYKTKESADTEFTSTTNPARNTDIQPLTGLGQRAASYRDGPSVGVIVQDGSFVLKLTWSANGVTVPAGVGEALVATARATLPKLKAT